MLLLLILLHFFAGTLSFFLFYLVLSILNEICVPPVSKMHACMYVYACENLAQMPVYKYLRLYLCVSVSYRHDKRRNIWVNK